MYIFLFVLYVKYVLSFSNTSECSCGWKKPDLNRVIGGRYSEEHEWPMMAGLVSTLTMFQFCGGTVISKHYVITAGHCVHSDGRKIPTHAFGVVVGIHNLDKITPQNVKPVKKIIPYPKYKWPLTYDVALLQVNEITYSLYVGPVCLPPSKINIIGKSIDHIGWGMTSASGSGSRILKKTKVKGVGLNICEMFYKHNDNPVDMVERYQMCTYQRGTSQCKGDSGGPLMLLDNKQNRYSLVGIISFGRDSCDYPVVNTDVGYFVDWIAQVIAGKGDKVCTTKGNFIVKK